MASFGFEVLPTADREQLALVAESLPPIHRQDIYNGDAEYHAWKNAQLPEPEHSESLNEPTSGEEKQPPWEEKEVNVA